MKIKLVILFIAVMFIFPGGGRCAELSQARQLFYEGNIYYGKEDFEQAIADYEEALELGIEGGSLYYNLGNAYFKQGFLGKAILNYLRAKRLIPQDVDLKSNLDYARSLIKGGVVIPERKWLSRVFFNLADSFSLDRVTLITAALYLILSIIVILLVITKNSKRVLAYIAGLVSVLLLVSASSFSAQYYKIIVQKEAVIIGQSSDAKFEPFDNATTFFTLNEGEAVTEVASKEGWIKIKRIDAKQGWIKAQAIEFL